MPRQTGPGSRLPGTRVRNRFSHPGRRLVTAQSRFPAAFPRTRRPSAAPRPRAPGAASAAPLRSSAP
eukprot:5248218-Prymnesium_polylepis.1